MLQFAQVLVLLKARTPRDSTSVQQRGDCLDLRTSCGRGVYCDTGQETSQQMRTGKHVSTCILVTLVGQGRTTRRPTTVSVRMLFVYTVCIIKRHGHYRRFYP